jgi:hypothetical protein
MYRWRPPRTVSWLRSPCVRSKPAMPRLGQRTCADCQSLPRRAIVSSSFPSSDGLLRGFGGWVRACAVAGLGVGVARHRAAAYWPATLPRALESGMRYLQLADGDVPAVELLVKVEPCTSWRS